MNALVLDSVTVSRGAGPVISDVSLTVEPGRTPSFEGGMRAALAETVSGVSRSILPRSSCSNSR